MMLPFGPFEPDKANLDAALSAEARNVYAGASSYLPMSSFAAFGTAALPAGCVGFSFAREGLGTWQIYAGTKTKLYKFVSGAWVDYSRTVGGAYNVPDGEYWSFCQFGSQLVVCNANDVPQVIDVDTGTANFAALAGSPPKARVAKAIGDFLWLIGVEAKPYHAKWSGLNDSIVWTIGTKLSDEQFYPTGGALMNVHGDKTGFILQEMAVRSFNFQAGSDYVYTFAEVEGAKGCIGPYASASVGSTVFYDSGQDGLYSIGPGGLNPIGAQRVNTWWANNTDPARRDQVYAVADPIAPRIIWNGYRNATSANFDIQLIYDWQIDRWTYALVSGQMMAPIAPPGVTLEQLNSYGPLDSLPASLDARMWQGGKPTLAIVGANRIMAFASGAPLEARIETVEAHLAPGQRAFASEAYPLVDAANASLEVGTRERLQDARVWGGAVTLERTGKFPLRSSGRLHRFRLTIPAGATWTHAQGLDVTAQPDGMQ